MAYFARRIETCPHRGAASPESVTQVHRCGLLEQIAREADLNHDSVADVKTEICRQCCRWFEPSGQDWNPVIASMVLDRLVKPETPADLDVSIGSSTLLQRAVAAIPIMDAEPRDVVPSETPPANIDSADRIETVMPLPRAAVSGCQQKLHRWMVGITSAPRRRPTIGHCLAALRLAGWTRAMVFIDGIATDDSFNAEPAMKDKTGITVVSRQTSVGGWSNFVLSAHELVHRDPDADAYMMLQDDALLARFSAVRPYVERLLDRIGSGAMASLYSCAADTRRNSGWHRTSEAVQRGGPGFVFGGDAMRRFLADPITRPWEGSEFRRGNGAMEQRGIDGNLGRWAARTGTPLWLPTPSLIWHLGETSTLWPGAVMLGIRRAGDFLERLL